MVFVLPRPRVCWQEDEIWLRNVGAKGGGAGWARADRAQLIVAIDARVVAVREIDLDRVAAHRRCGLGSGFGLEHGKRGRRCGQRNGGWRGVGVRCICFFTFRGGAFLAFVVAGGARTGVAQIRKIIVSTPAPVETWIFTALGFLRGSRGVGIKRGRCWC